MICSRLLWITSGLLAVISYWNLLTFNKIAASFPPRSSEDQLFRQSQRYEGIRNALLTAGYTEGMLGFITNRDLKFQASTAGDDLRWSQAYFLMLPWIVLHGTRAVS